MIISIFPCRAKRYIVQFFYFTLSIRIQRVICRKLVTSETVFDSSGKDNSRRPKP